MIALLFDTETTGLIDNHTLPLDKQPEIVEYYGVVVDLANGEQISELDLLIKPTRPIDEADISTKKHGILNADVADAPLFADVAGKIQDQFNIGAKPIAHNASFDVEMIGIEFERLGMAFHMPKKALCTVEATVHLTGFRLGLNDLHERLFGANFPEAHRAKNDVQALVRCCCKLYEMGEI